MQVTDQRFPVDVQLCICIFSQRCSNICVYVGVCYARFRKKNKRLLKERPISYTQVFISNYCKQEANVFSLSMYVVDLFGVLTV